MDVYVYVYMHAHICIYIYMHAHVYTHVCMYKHIYTYIYICLYIHTYRFHYSCASFIPKYTNIYKSVVNDIPFAADYFLTLKYRHILDVPFWNKTNVFHFKEVRSQISKGLEIFKRYNYNFRKYQIF